MLLLLALAGPVPSAEIAGVATVEDGDSLAIRGQKIRLHGVDAPEGRQLCTRDGKPWRCGQAAANALAEHLRGRPVTCRVRARDRYERLVSDCTVGAESVNAWLVREGWAQAYRRYSPAYVDEEEAARAARRGIWSAEFTPPWEWREQQRAETPAAAPADEARRCRIKGNVSQRNRRIYHLPGDPDYDDTRIDPRRGERWFCSEADARAAGWRRARP